MVWLHAVAMLLVLKLIQQYFHLFLRGISLCGIDSAESAIDFKSSIWNKFADEWKIDLSPMIKIVTKENLQQEIDLILKGGQQGRVVLTHGE